MPVHAMSLDPVVRQRIQSLLEAHPVVLFMKGTPRAPQCGFSARTVQALAAIGLDDYHAVDVLADADIREGIKLFGNWPTIPQLYVRGELVGGSDIVGQMADSGELQSALGLPPPDRTPPSIEVTPAAIAMLREAIDNAGEGIAVQVQLDPQYQAKPVVRVAKIGKVTVVKEGDVVKLGQLAMTAHMTPGHTPGATTWSWTSCEDQRCLNIVYADSLNAYSSGDFTFTGKGKEKTADISASFEASIAKVAALPCDVIISVHPGMTKVLEKAAGRSSEYNPFIDANGCRAYADNAGKLLAKRLASERGEASPAAAPHSH